VRSGPAVIRDLRRGYTFVTDDAVYDGNAVTFAGRLRNKTLTGVSLGAPKWWTLPIAGAEIEWMDNAPDTRASQDEVLAL
jgi:hypothetical protein